MWPFCFPVCQVPSERKGSNFDRVASLKKYLFPLNKTIINCYPYRKIITEGNLEKDTLDAQAAELERQKRLADIKKSMLLKQQAEIKLENEKKAAKPEKDSQLKSLLQGLFFINDLCVTVSYT